MQCLAPLHAQPNRKLTSNTTKKEKFNRKKEILSVNQVGNGGKNSWKK